MSSHEPLLMTVESAAEMLSIGRTRMFDLINKGEVSSVIIGRSRRVPLVALQQYVAGLSDDSTDDTDRAA